MARRKTKLWLDDVRKPPDNSWAWAKSADGAIALLKEGGIIEASLDHDLDMANYAGYYGQGSGIEVARFIAGMETPPTVVHVHSMNPVGAKAMREILGVR